MDGVKAQPDQAADERRNGNESKREAFVRLATNRTNNVLERIRILSNCANPNAYEYTEDDIRRIFGAIEDELKIARNRFVTPKRRSFKLD